MADDSIQDGQPGPMSVEIPPVTIESDDVNVVCPRCARVTDSLKVYDQGVVGRRSQVVVSCPECMRRSLRRQALIVFPWSLCLMPFFAWFLYRDFRESHRKGHSDPAVAATYRMNRKEQFELVLQRLNLRKTPRREWVVLACLLLLIAGLWAIALLWRRWLLSKA